MAHIDYQKASRLLKAFAHPTRLMIISQLLKKRKCVNEIKELLGVTQPNISQHLALLKLHGIVGYTQAGKKKCYCLKDATLAAEVVKLIIKHGCT
jgi:DNA-binding transcriptional ArsR family regulator